MGTDLQLFTFPPTTQEIRVLQIDGDPWFVAGDVCAVLEIGNLSMAMQGLDDDEKQQVSANISNTEVYARGRDPYVISEAGFYTMVMRSRKEQAGPFRRWVTHEVLPQIRRTGSYAPQRELSRLEMARKQVELSQELLAAEERNHELELDLKVKAAQNLALEAKKREDAPKVTAYDHLMDAEGTFSMAAAAQILNMGFGRTGLFALLRQEKVITQSLAEPRPIQVYLDRGYFVMKAGPGRPTTDGFETRHTMRVTPKGLDYLRKRFCETA